MTLEDFKSYFNFILEETSFYKLLQTNIKSDEEALSYLSQRKVMGIIETLGMEIFVYEGPFRYKGKDYSLSKSIIIPLKSPTDDLRGVMIRSIHQKQFYIWMIGDNQKYWISPQFDQSKKVYLFESIFDALSFAFMTGETNIAANLGVTPTNDLQKILSREVILALDNDPAGKNNSLSLLTLHPQWGIISSNLNQFKDYNEFLISDNHLEFKELMGIQARIYLKSTI